MKALPEDILEDLKALPGADLEQVRAFVAFLRWRASEAGGSAPDETARLWHYNFLESFANADVRTSRDAAGAEVKIAEARAGGELRPALWQHPPIQGESEVEYHVPVPANLRDVRLRFAIGIRDGAKATDRLIAFRVRLDGWQIWSRAAWPVSWEPVELALPYRAGDIARVVFATDGLGDHQWAWAAWAEPVLIGRLQ